ncbi:hypothetical protein K461DRAFT_2120 [Myriangium duriaei CBS 260.36]|uniref:DUF676 domain-containing protein n=1 Tax=Myriangium duriaei CBS 260.36 TaxID=1168546 RepID=A0A9P4MKW0_9PEZI|nr:hypothetical protein K461DRAFT_2120 [Myriangium duriaei CBS 260.36]
MLSWKPRSGKRQRVVGRVGSRDKASTGANSPGLDDSARSESSRSEVQDLFPGNRTDGVRVLHTPDNAVVDIVFLHGLTGSADKTFLHVESHTYWPVHLLTKDITDARILTFGYDANVVNFFDSAGQNTLQSHALDLIGDLADKRDTQSSATRKIFFIAHSLGGLVVKQAMALSKSESQQHLKSIQEHTAGIVFLGTPHRGSDLAALANAVNAIVKATGKNTNADIMQVLKRDSQLLASVEKFFGNWVNESRARIELACFCEELGVRQVGMVVTRESASIPDWPSLSIHANHMDMTKFASSEDLGYQRILGQLKRWIRPLRAQQGQYVPSSAGN